MLAEVCFCFKSRWRSADAAFVDTPIVAVSVHAQTGYQALPELVNFLIRI